MSKIYDSFCFFNELDILELRLNILNDVVDKFIICESSVTHSGKQKKFYFEENKDRYSKFLDKIIHVKVFDTPASFNYLQKIQNPNEDQKYINEIYDFISKTRAFDRTTQPHYGRDFYQKECVRRGMSECKDDDIILFSDCDEIPNPEILQYIKHIISNDKFYTLKQNMYYYFLNVLKENNWGGTRLGTYKYLKNYSYNELRNQKNIELENGGWHFSYMGGVELIKQKIEAYSAQEYNLDVVKNNLQENINNFNDPLFRGKLQKVEIDDTYPKYILDNLDKYKAFIK
jgi:beta-1,4-mannosyl-glycoprotein beta-1,4-N-acetylglucosaminyltransferase